MPQEMSDPRSLHSQGTFGELDPHGRDDHMMDARNAVHLQEVTVSMITEGNRGQLLAALVLSGRINQTQDQARVLFVLNADGIAAIFSELVGLLGRADMGHAARAHLISRLEQLEMEGNLAPKQASTEQCACFYYERDPEAEGDEICMCGHAADEHDEHGDCQVDVEI